MKELAKKIFVFQDGVAYPMSGGYHVRLGSKWQIDDSNEYPSCWQLVKVCRVNRYRYPFVQFLKRDCEIVHIDEKIGTEEDIKRFTWNCLLYITRR